MSIHNARSEMPEPFAAWRRVLQAATHPRWAWDVGLRGRPHDLGNVSAYLGHRIRLADSGVRSGLDVVRLLAQGADGVLLGRAFVYALPSASRAWPMCWT